MDRFDFYFRQKVSEGELDAAFDEAENALWAVAIDHALTGIAANAVVTEKSGTPNLTVDVSGSALVYDKLGRRIAFGPLQNVDVSVDESAVSTAVGTPGNEKIVSGPKDATGEYREMLVRLLTRQLWAETQESTSLQLVPLPPSLEHKYSRRQHSTGLQTVEAVVNTSSSSRSAAVDALPK